MENEAKILRCGQCECFKPTNIGIVQYAKVLVDKYETKRGPLPTDERVGLLTKVACNMADIGIRSCEEESVVLALRICDKKNTYSPRKNLKYWLLTFQKAVSHFQI